MVLISFSLKSAYLMKAACDDCIWGQATGPVGGTFCISYDCIKKA